MQGLLNTRQMVQVGYIVKDIETTKKKYAEFLGVPVPPTMQSTGGEAGFKVTRTVYKDQEAPHIDSKLAFFNVGGPMDIELIEPNEAESIWRDYLEKYGEGIQHIAFVVDDLDECIENCEKFGMKMIQKGYFAAQDGRYAYMDAYDSLKTVVELLERWS
ncbi:VOC family protein [Diplocloster hominis]|uniref:VOC family protein n=1 Tax=Diplocloster hominis TaxID=3079010 RepID=UPI0031BAC076